RHSLEPSGPEAITHGRAQVQWWKPRELSTDLLRQVRRRRRDRAHVAREERKREWRHRFQSALDLSARVAFLTRGDELRLGVARIQDGIVVERVASRNVLVEEREYRRRELELLFGKTRLEPALVAARRFVALDSAGSYIDARRRVEGRAGRREQ